MYIWHKIVFVLPTAYISLMSNRYSISDTAKKTTP